MRARLAKSLFEDVIELRHDEQVWLFDIEGINKYAKSNKCEDEMSDLRTSIREGEIQALGYDEEKGIQLYVLVESSDSPFGISRVKSKKLSEAIHKSRASEVQLNSEDMRKFLLERVKDYSSK